MKKIMYEDCNNNAYFLKGIFSEIQSFVNVELIWNVSDIEIIPIDQGDFVNGSYGADREKVYNFGKKILDEQEVQINNNALLEILNFTKVIYYGLFTTTIDSNLITIKIFDGDIIEIQGVIEDKINITI